MGRRKVQVKLIQDKSSRQVTFSKRRKGLIKKASELSILCDVAVAVVIFSSRGRLYEFCSFDSMAGILQRFHKHCEEETQASMIVDAADSHSDYFSLMSNVELEQLVKRQLEGPNFEHMRLTDLVQLEKRLDATLAQIRGRKTELMLEFISMLQDKEKKLTEEKGLLEKQIAELMNNSHADTKPVKTTLQLFW